MKALFVGCSRHQKHSDSFHHQGYNTQASDVLTVVPWTCFSRLIERPLEALQSELWLCAAAESFSGKGGPLVTAIVMYVVERLKKVLGGFGGA